MQNTEVIVYQFLWIFPNKDNLYFPNNAFSFFLPFLNKENKFFSFGKCMANDKFMFASSCPLIELFKSKQKNFVLRM